MQSAHRSRAASRAASVRTVRPNGMARGDAVSVSGNLRIQQEVFQHRSEKMVTPIRVPSRVQDQTGACDAREMLLAR